MLLLSEDDVERLIEPRAAIALMRETYRRQSAGESPAPGRLDMARSDPKGSVLVLTGHEGSHFALKSNLHVYPDPASRLRRAQSLMTLWDSAAGTPLALLATTRFNNHRTAAGLAAAADILASRDAKTLAMIGAGKIAPAAIGYLSLVRPLQRIVIVGKGSERAQALVEAMQAVMPSVRVEATTDAAHAVADADIVVTLTTSAVSVFPGRAVKPGALVILAGANRPDAREADDGLMARATVWMDDRHHCLDRAGDLVMPLASGRLTPERIAGEIGALSAPPVLQDAADVMVFKSMGMIGQDIALATAIVERAKADGVGTRFDPFTGRIGIAP